MGVTRPLALLLSILLAFSTLPRHGSAFESLVIVRVDRKIDLQSSTVRISTNIKVENAGAEPTSKVLLALPKALNSHVSFASVSSVSGKAKNKAYKKLELNLATFDGAPTNVTFLSVQLAKPIAKGESVLLELYFAFSNLITPFPKEIAQADAQLVLFKDSHYLLSPYPVHTQVTSIRLPSSQVESYTQLSPSKKVDSELRFGPYTDVPPLELSQLSVHFEFNRPLPVIKSLVKEIQISHWGNIYVTEDYVLVNSAATHKGVFSRLDYQNRPTGSALAALRGLVAILPPHAHSVYYRDEIGNISTSNMRQDNRRTELEVQPRYPLMGGWSVSFRIGYSLPLSDFVHALSDGTRVLNMTVGTPLGDTLIESLTLKVVLPEGSIDISTDLPFPLAKSSQTTYSYLDTFGRPTVVLQKENVVAEQGSMPFLVNYKFPAVFLLMEPFLLVAFFLVFFVICIVYVRADFTIARSSPAYIARLQKEQVVDALQRLQRAMAARGAVAEALDASLVKLGRSGDVAAAKAARKEAEAELKEGSKTLKDIQGALEDQPLVLRSVQALIAREKETQDKALQKHVVSVEAYEKSLSAKEIDAKVQPIQQKLVALKAEVKSMLLQLED